MNILNKIIAFILLLPIALYTGTKWWWQEKHLENNWLDDVMEAMDYHAGKY